MKKNTSFVIALVVLYLIVVGRWAFGQVTSNLDDRNAAQAATRETERRIEAGRRINLAELDQRYAEVIVQLPSGREYPDLIDQINNAASALNAQWLRGTPSEVTTALPTTDSPDNPDGNPNADLENPVRELPEGLTVEIQADPEVFQDFLTNFYNLPRATVVNAVCIGRAPSCTIDQRYSDSLRIQAQVYRWPGLAALAPKPDTSGS